jgi:uncharacterized protein (TIGR03437 family)
MLLILLAFLPQLGLSQRVVTTFAGRDWFFDFRNKAALQSPLSFNVHRIATDREGNLYIADPENHQVYRVTPSGILDTVAGNGIADFTGDGGAAIDASLDFPYAVAVDAQNNLYIYDGFNYRIRRVTPQGIISTFAGNGRNEFSGDGGSALNAGLGFVEDMVFDNDGNLLIGALNRVRSISPNGVIRTIAGTGQFGTQGNGGLATQAQLQGVAALAVDRNGLIYVGTYGNQIRRISREGVISAFAGTGQRGYSGDGGPASAATFDAILALIVDAQGNVFVSDSDNYVVRQITPAGIISTYAGNGNFGFSGDGLAPNQAAFRFTIGLAFAANGDLLVVDRGNGRVRRIQQGRTVATFAGNGQYRSSADGTAALDTYLFQPSGVAIHPTTGEIYISDTSNNIIRKVDRNGQTTRVAGLGFRSYGPEGVDARNSGLYLPRGIAFSPTGELAIADRANDLVRRVNAQGVINKIAGNFDRGFSGDGGPALNAALCLPSAVAYDPLGNFYIADTCNNRVRRVGTDGIIRTFAGNGQATSSGDGLAATSAGVIAPLAVALDRSGNVYIGEYDSCRVRRVTADGIIRAFAGSGACGYSGDGGPATSARLGYVTGLAFDSAGNLYISDDLNNLVRRVGTDGVISTFAGSGVAGFSGDGGPATSASLRGPFGLAADAAGRVYIADFSNDRIRQVLTSTTGYSVSPGSLTFSATSGSGVTTEQTLTLAGTLQGIPFTATPSAPWIRVNPANGTMPNRVAVSVDPAALAAGNYSGTIRITAPGAQPPTVDIPVSLTLTAAQPPRISLGSATLAFSLTQGAQAATRQLAVANIGSGSLNVQASVAAGTGGNWLSVSPANGTATPNAPVSLTVTANPAGLAPGTYSASISLITNGGNASVPVSLAVGAPQSSKIVLSQLGMTFNVVSGGGRTLSQPLAILNTGAGSLNWQARGVTLSGGGGWLRLSSTAGTVDRPFLDLSSIDISVEGASLAPGQYYGQIQVTSPTADNSPQTISVVLNVLPAGTNPGPEVQPTALVFIRSASTGSQTIRIANPTSTAVSFGSSRTFLQSGGNWFQQLPSEGTVSPTDASRIVVQPQFQGLPVGATRSFLNLGFSDGSSRVVNILSIVPPPDAGDAKDGRVGAARCSRPDLRVELTSLQRPQFAATIGQPVRIEAKIVDDCGNPLLPSDGSPLVQASFSNQDRRVDLQHTGNGVWAGTWTPVNGSGPVTVEVNALLLLGGNRSQAGGASISGQLNQPGQQRAPLVAPGAVVNAASYEGAVVSPGGYVSIFGVKLADNTGQAGSVPLPTDINGTKVTLAGRDLPLNFVGDGQVNALVPYDLTINTQHQLVVQRGAALSVPEAVVVAPAQPAIYTQNQSGSGPGVIVNGVTNVLNTAAAPARAGDVLTIYANGLGAVNPPVPLGAAAPPAGPLSRTVNPVTVRIGGIAVQPQFAGLAPGFPGLYQINVQVPAGVTPGDAVPVTIEVAGQVSKPVTIFVR